MKIPQDLIDATMKAGLGYVRVSIVAGFRGRTSGRWYEIYVYDRRSFAGRRANCLAWLDGFSAGKKEMK